MTKFSDLKLDPKVLQAIAEAGYETPTPIQAGAIPPALEGRDVMLPRHSEEMAFRPDRDSIFLHKNPDGSIDAWLHDIDGGATRLYGASEVLAMAAVQDDREMATAADHRLTA